MDATACWYAHIRGAQHEYDSVRQYVGVSGRCYRLCHNYAYLARVGPQKSPTWMRVNAQRLPC